MVTCRSNIFYYVGEYPIPQEKFWTATISTTKFSRSFERNNFMSGRFKALEIWKIDCKGPKFQEIVLKASKGREHSGFVDRAAIRN